MNKGNIILTITIILTIILLTPNILAYDNTTLVSYYTMGDGNTQTIYDTHKATTLTIRYPTNLELKSQIGIIGNALYTTEFSTTNVFMRDTNTTYTNKSWSFNTWILKPSPLTSYGRILALKINWTDFLDIDILTNETHIKGIGGDYIINSSINNYQQLNTWNMITITYNHNRTELKAYINGEYIGNATVPKITENYKQLDYHWFGWLSTLDETSFWITTDESKILNSNDIIILYNYGSGLNYEQTLAQSSAPIENASDDGYFHDYCYYNIACVNYNYTSEECVDDIYKWCNIAYPGSTTYESACADTFSLYYPNVYNISSFSATCYNNSYIYVNKSAMYDNLHHNYCWNNVVCTNYNYTDDYCMDDILKVCIQNTTHYGCADTYDLYNGAGYDLDLVNSFDAECYGDAYYYIYPEFEGIYGAQNICIDKYTLCKQLSLNSTTCEPYINGTPNIINCAIYDGVNLIGGECVDNQSYYSGGYYITYPPNNDYGGYCKGLFSDCTTINAKSCYNATHIQTCLALTYNTSIYKNTLTLESNTICNTPSYYCSSGVCIRNITGGGLPQFNETGGTGDATSDLLLGVGLSTPMKYMIVLLVLVITIISFAYIGNSAGATKIGLIIGLVLAIFEFIAFSVLGWIPVWILILLVLVTLMILGFSIFIKSSGGE